MGFRIVVDTSVARAAGESSKEEPQACRESLLAILQHGHRAAMSKQLFSEWLKIRPDTHVPYATLFALRWLTDMQSQNRVDNIHLEENSSLRQRCLNFLESNPETRTLVEPVGKDFHLVETALAADHRVLSLDKKIKRHLQNLRDTAQEICAILWIHPQEHQAPAWLKNGAKENASWKICDTERKPPTP